ncbi:MAG: indole-3-glycerol phosphate synthase TrpC [bacterium]|nr:indole-3-glycerol phosphate synthase TrpC [bacterium]MDD3805259.1 indole-3-glycerol phosphate synthase TrpC [bacterium]MDD4557498.1 indole-3-glycerol phosphate synthase TrpC [bacterium]
MSCFNGSTRLCLQATARQARLRSTSYGAASKEGTAFEGGFLSIMRKLKEAEIAERCQRYSLTELKAACRDLASSRDFAGALSRPGISIIAELKYASPSKGRICSGPAPEEVAKSYELGGAAAISVLTEEKHFCGDMAYLGRVRAVVNLPLLRKDFIIDPYQVYESRLAGADAVLLIKAMLSVGQLSDLIGLAAELGLAALTEVHDEAEMEEALSADARLIGINNRDLSTLAVDIDRGIELAGRYREKKAGKGLLLIAESGYFRHEDIALLPQQGIDAVLVGEALMRAEDKAVAIGILLGGKSDDQS